MADGREVVADVGILSFWVELTTSGTGVTGWDADGDTSVSVVVEVSSDVVDSLWTEVGIAVDVVSVVKVGRGSGVVMVVKWGSAVVVSGGLVVFAVVTGSADVVMVVVVTSDVVVVSELGVTVGGLTVVDLVITAAGLVATVTLAVNGLMVARSVNVVLGVILVVTGSLGVVLRVVVCVIMVVVRPDITLEVDTSRVVTLSRIVVVVGGAVEVVVPSGDEDGWDVVADVVDTWTLPVSGCIVSVIS